uniref:Zf-tcix domain-containing protein n=1 Tax=Rhodnius prolixus TaxID=13249 RepID=T1HAD3_RHOPR
MQNEDRLRAMLSDLGRSTLRGIRKCPKCGTYNGIRGLSCKNKACDMVFKEAGEKRKQSMEVAKLDTGLSTQERQAMSVTTCQHIQSAMRCCADAQVLPIDSDVLKSLSISNQMKEAIWQLALETPGPLVQRVSKSIMAVKCKVTTKHPLGFLHVSFFPSTKLKENNFSCACTPKNQSKSPNESIRNCVHYYSCIVAFASNDKCLEEFGSFIMKERAPESFTLDLNSSAEEEQNHFVAILESEIGHDSVESVLPKDMMLPDISQDFDRLTTVVEDITHELETGLDHQALESVIIKADEIPLKQEELSKSQKRKRGTTNKQGDSGKKFLKKDLRKQLHISDEAVDESKVQMTFIEWLASVTERINQTMHFQFDGKPEPLVFHAPHNVNKTRKKDIPLTCFIPGMNFTYGKSYAQAADESMTKFTIKKAALESKKALETTLRNRERQEQVMQPTYPHDKLTEALMDYDCKHRYKDEHISPEQPPIAGYTGHIPRIKSTEASLSQRYHTAAKRGLYLLQQPEFLIAKEILASRIEKNGYVQIVTAR